jgi:hypothetical protein
VIAEAPLLAADSDEAGQDSNLKPATCSDPKPAGVPI